MMNVIYSCCVADPFIDVAIELKNKYGINPVYWIGDKATAREANAVKQLVEEAFPDCIYHDFHDAWHGKFPEVIDKIGADTYVDVDFMRDFSCEELQAFTMMNRLDFDRRSFNYMERERFYIRLVKYWTACLDLYNPVCVIGARTPHRVFDYVLYLLCQRRNIPVTSFQFAASNKRIFAMTGFSEPDKIRSIIKERYEYYLTQNHLDENLLPPDIRMNYDRTKSDYTKARPEYMKNHEAFSKKVHNPFFLLQKFISSNHIFGKKSIFLKGAKANIYKNGKYSIEDSHFSVYDWYSERFAAGRYKKKLKDLYNSLAKPVDTNVPYIVFYLHYQPEVTTSPIGDIFVNQQLCIEVLLKHTPKNYMIYVKEHPTQFMFQFLGHTSRIADFYTDLVKYSRVRLVPFDTNSFDIMENAKAVATVTGTVGWEAMLHKKPVIAFGQTWYEAMKGVLRITDEASALGIQSFIDNYQYDEHAILAYLLSVADNSVEAYHYDGYKRHATISKEECVKNIVKELRRLIPEIK